MSDLREVNAIHQAVSNNLMRRRELAQMTKPQLISYIVNIENNLEALTQRIEHGYTDIP